MLGTGEVFGPVEGAVTVGLPVQRGFDLAALLVDSDPFVTGA